MTKQSNPRQEHSLPQKGAGSPGAERHPIPVGIRNNNPLNIRKTAIRWRGEVPLSDSPLKGGAQSLPSGGGQEGSFVRFVSMEWGIRAACCILRTYAKRYNAVCVQDIVRRWAPPTENDTERYIRNVCRWSGLGGMQRLTEREWPLLIKAMARQECGTAPSDATIERGCRLYQLTNNTINKEFNP